MLGDFMYCSPVRVYFGRKCMRRLSRELAPYKSVLLIYGTGSIKKNGIYDQIREILDLSGCRVREFAGVRPNPDRDCLYRAVSAAREFHPDLILAAGGGSVCDLAKAVSVSIYCREDPWQRYYLQMKKPDCPVVPVGCIPTTAGTGSEMNGCAVISDPERQLKIGHVFGDDVYPRFALINPAYTLTLNRQQTACGIFDIMTHLCEQYFSGKDDCATDYMIEGLMRSLINSSRAVMADPSDYEARSNIMWISSIALSTLLSKGKKTDWMLHMVAQAVGACTDAAHGSTLSALAMPYYRFIYSAGIGRFVRFAVNVWGIRTDQVIYPGADLYEGNEKMPDAEELARRGLDCMEQWMKELGLVMSLSQLGVTEDMYPDILRGIKITKGGYRRLTKDDVIRLLKAAD